MFYAVFSFKCFYRHFESHEICSMDKAILSCASDEVNVITYELFVQLLTETIFLLPPIPDPQPSHAHCPLCVR